MNTLLHLDASANRSGESITRALSARFAAAWLDANPTGTHRYRDLAADPVPALTTEFCAIGRRVEQHPPIGRLGVDALLESEDERADWRVTRALVDELVDADTVLLGCPMYNFSVPAALKGWIDRITFPGVYRAADGSALLAGTNVVVVAASGGGYGPGTPRAAWDFQAPYLRAWLTSIGVPDERIHVIRAELTLADLAPGLADLRPLATASFEAALASLDAVLPACVPAAMSAERTSPKE
ncbi:FMN-dependent NADH-azoreductase [Desertimonas flava]|uniref:FMN-dependent NADH-azoreductase n=1 Tax=Desertimonas flava TaxID=2064846 RepID=UPI000E350935|nr:NAD(P)H-dependent oxidoreductase [Desertimonas flava]